MTSVKALSIILQGEFDPKLPLYLFVPVHRGMLLLLLFLAFD